MTDETKKTRGPMSEDARVLLAKRKFREEVQPLGPMTAETALGAVRGIGPQPPNAAPVLAANNHEKIGEFLRIVEKLSDAGRADLLKLIS